MIIEAAVVGGAIVGGIIIKVLIGLAGAAIAALCIGIYVLLRDYFKDNPDDEEKANEAYQARQEERMDNLDKVVGNTKNNTEDIRQKTTAHNDQMGKITKAFANTSATWTEEGKNLHQLTQQLRLVITEQHKKLQIVTQQLQQQTKALPAASEGLAQSRLLLIERQNDIATFIKLLNPILEQLEARNSEWIAINQTLQKLGTTNSQNQREITKLYENKKSLIAEVKALNTQLTKAMATIKELEETKKGYKEVIGSLRNKADEKNNRESNPRFF